GQENNIAVTQNNIRALLVEAGRLNGKLAIDVIGHTDITGVEGTNRVPSKQPADVIINLPARPGIKPANLRGRGVGTSEPLHDESTEEGPRSNRSVPLNAPF